MKKSVYKVFYLFALLFCIAFMGCENNVNDSGKEVSNVSILDLDGRGLIVSWKEPEYEGFSKVEITVDGRETVTVNQGTNWKRVDGTSSSTVVFIQTVDKDGNKSDGKFFVHTKTVNNTSSK